MPVGFQKLGWQWPRPNDFTDPNERPLRDTFNHLQRHLTFPYVGLRFDGVMDLSGTLTVINWTVKSAAASPFVAGDPYQLYRPTPDQVQVPRDFDTWMLIGSACFLTTGGAASAVLTTGWRINSVNGEFFDHNTGNAASRVTTPVMTPVRKGDTVEIVIASTDITEDLTDAEAWMIFMPLA